jgi:DNA primase
VAIPAEDVAAVRAQTDIVALIGEHLSLRRQGRRWVGLCPFHTEKTPSFSVNAEQGLYYCFGCQASGDAITFLRAIEHLEFAEAVERLAARAGIAIHHEGSRRAVSSQRERLLQAMEAAVAFYHDRLLRHADAGPARLYLRSRGYDEETVRMFRLGWAPGEWDALARALSVPGDVLKDAGLSIVNRAGRRQDLFRSRVIFPIFDAGGRPVALGGRLLPPGPPAPGAAPGSSASGAAPGSSVPGAAPGPKYLNSPETPIYTKRRTLYGLNWAKAGIIDAGEVVVTEGYTDVIAFHRAGVPRAVATCGTALSEDHVRTLRNFASRIVLAYDADAAGQAAAARFYEWERRFELDIAVAGLPAGRDPGDVGAEDPAALRAAVEHARPYLDFRVEQVLVAADLRTAEGRAKAADAVLDAVAEHPMELVRDQYVMKVADRCRFEPETLRPLLERKRKEARAGRAGTPRPISMSRPPASGPGVSSRSASAASQFSGAASPPPAASFRPPAVSSRPAVSGSAAESLPSGPGPPGAASRSPGPTQRPVVAGPARTGEEALRLAIHRPAEVADHLEEVLFGDPVQRAALRALLSSVTLHEALSRAEPEAAALLARLAVEDTDADPREVVSRLARAAGERALAGLYATSRSLPVEEAASLIGPASQLRQLLEALNEGADGMEAAARLVAWLSQHGEEGA